MEILHVATQIDECEQVTISLPDVRTGAVSAAEIILSLGWPEYHRNLSWL